MVAALDSISIGEIDLQAGGMLVLHTVSWERYEAIAATLATRHKYRTAYLDGVLEIMAPMPAHERPHRMIGYFVTALLDAAERDWEDFGGTTFRQPAQQAGLEPDTCFYVDDNARLVRDCLEPMDLEVYPPPDLAIDADVTSTTTLAVYLRLAVPEVWVWRQGKLKIHQLQNEQYVESSQSLVFPNFSIPELYGGPRKLDNSLSSGIFS